MNEPVNVATNSMTLATSPVSLNNEVPESVSYIVDVVFILVFLFILFFVKPKEEPKEELTEEEKPNPLEQVLRTDPEDSSDSNNTFEKNENSKSDDGKK